MRKRKERERETRSHTYRQRSARERSPTTQETQVGQEIEYKNAYINICMQMTRTVTADQVGETGVDA